ncbi:hypothetical protein ACFW1A_18510 [Kitasatospora sp. NPDC058965]|uniref:hypothetical protein n=1 Tax=Kitasatospora sp. NPDC058965 TaxID=3346682 RepID=UPI0036977832
MRWLAGLHRDPSCCLDAWPAGLLAPVPLTRFAVLRVSAGLGLEAFEELRRTQRLGPVLHSIHRATVEFLAAGADDTGDADSITGDANAERMARRCSRPGTRRAVYTSRRTAATHSTATSSGPRISAGPRATNCRALRLVLRPVWFAGLERRTVVFVEIVFAGLPIDRDEVEEALEAAFGSEGEITGAGGGMGRCHLDLEIGASLDPDTALDRLRAVLADLGVEEHATLNVSD